jgi:hypothetical protein
VGTFRTTQLDPRRWLENFTPDELPLAVRLIDGFTYFSHDLVKQLFRAAFLNISQLAVTSKDNYVAARTEWATFVNSVLVVRVTGESPSDTDSGFAFARHARDLLKIPEASIIGPGDAVRKLAKSGFGNVLFVDDFVGSGDQFVTTWQRRHELWRGGPLESLESIASAASQIAFYYAPCICTTEGAENILKVCPAVKISAGHMLDIRHSALSNPSFIWREDMAEDGPAFVRNSSGRAGIPDMNGDKGDWRGYQKLGLAVAFAHGCPDATLPLFTWSRNGWHPLISTSAI